MEQQAEDGARQPGAADAARLGQRRLVGRPQLRQRTLDRRVELRQQPRHHLRPQVRLTFARQRRLLRGFSCSPRAYVNRRSRLPAACRAWKPTDAAPPGVTQTSAGDSPAERGVQLLAGLQERMSHRLQQRRDVGKWTSEPDFRSVCHLVLSGPDRSKAAEQPCQERDGRRQRRSSPARGRRLRPATPNSSMAAAQPHSSCDSMPAHGLMLAHFIRGLALGLPYAFTRGPRAAPLCGSLGRSRASHIRWKFFSISRLVRRSTTGRPCGQTLEYAVRRSSARM